MGRGVMEEEVGVGGLEKKIYDLTAYKGSSHSSPSIDLPGPRAFKVVLGTNQMVDETLAELQEAVSSSTFVPDPSDGVFASAAKAKVSLDLLFCNIMFFDRIRLRRSAQMR